MDVLSLDYSHSAPHRTPDDLGRPAGSRPARLLDRLGRLVAPGGGGASGPPGDGTAAVSTWNVLHGFTAAEILLGVALVAFVTVAVPLGPAIASPSLAGTALAGETGGVLLWTLFGLMATVRSSSAPGGSVHFSFDLPFVGAAMILGGPTAGAWVALLSTFDRRELESQPWYGMLANHTATATAAILGGLAYVLVGNGLTALSGDDKLAGFAAIIVAGFVLEVVASGLAVVTVKLRGQVTWGRVLGVAMGSFRSEMLLEVALIWVLVIATLHVAWWAPVVVGLAITAYLGLRPAMPAAPDPLTGLPAKATFLAGAERKLRSIRRGTLAGGTLLLLDIRDFHRVNEERGHEAGDAVLRVIADRLRSQFPGDGDLLGRLINDRFGVFVPALIARNAAVDVARELVAAIGRPIATRDGPLSVSAAIGIVLVPGAEPTHPSVGTLMVRAEQALALAKDEGGGSSAWHLWAPDDRPPFGG